MIQGDYAITIISAIFGVWGLGFVILFALQITRRYRQIIIGLWPVYFSEAVILAAGCLFVLAPTPLAQILQLSALGRIYFEAASLFRQNKFQSISVKTIWNIFFPIVPYTALIACLYLPQNHSTLLLSLLLVEVFDSFALLGGKLLGKHMPIKSLSPNKTFEGYVCGLTALAIATFSLTWILNLSLLHCAFFVLCTLLGATAGDLLASYQKRKASTKDYPPIWHKQGGLLDIYDAWLVAAPLTVGSLWLFA